MRHLYLSVLIGLISFGCAAQASSSDETIVINTEAPQWHAAIRIQDSVVPNATQVSIRIPEQNLLFTLQPRNGGWERELTDEELTQLLKGQASKVYEAQVSAVAVSQKQRESRIERTIKIEFRKPATNVKAANSRILEH